jgi:hypothetical protein
MSAATAGYWVGRSRVAIKAQSLIGTTERQGMFKNGAVVHRTPVKEYFGADFR